MRIAPDIHAVKQNPSLCWAVKTADKFHQGSLSRAVLPDKRKFFPRPNRKINITKRKVLTFRIAETDMLKLDSFKIMLFFYHASISFFHIIPHPIEVFRQIHKPEKVQKMLVVIP